MARRTLKAEIIQQQTVLELVVDADKSFAEVATAGGQRTSTSGEAAPSITQSGSSSDVEAAPPASMSRSISSATISPAAADSNGSTITRQSDAHASVLQKLKGHAIAARSLLANNIVLPVQYMLDNTRPVSAVIFGMILLQVSIKCSF